MSEEKKVKSEWVHFRELRARCPVCKKVAHVACKNGTYFFVHDAYDPFARHNAVETTEPVFKILFDGFVSVNGREPVKSGNRALSCLSPYSLGGIAGMQERMERAYEKKSEQGEKPIYEPKDFHVIDEIKDPRELAEELREALNPSTTIDEKISFLEEIAAQNGGQL